MGRRYRHRSGAEVRFLVAVGSLTRKASLGFCLRVGISIFQFSTSVHTLTIDLVSLICTLYTLVLLIKSRFPRGRLF